MPPRWLTLGIIGFWLATTAWMLWREVMPRWRAGEPPPYTLDLVDEISDADRPAYVHWTVLEKGVQVGEARSSVHRAGPHQFELRSEIHLRNVLLFDKALFDNVYEINDRGELLRAFAGLKAKMKLGLNVVTVI